MAENAALFTTNGVAEKIGGYPALISKLAVRHKVPHFTLNGNRMAFPESSVEILRPLVREWLDRERITA
jgi:hypothetical protein